MFQAPAGSDEALLDEPFLANIAFDLGRPRPREAVLRRVARCGAARLFAGLKALRYG